VLAKENGVPFYVAAPLSTFDPACPDGDAIPIEERGEEEVLVLSGALEDGGHGSIRLAPEGARALNFAFDVTPAQYITGFITEIVASVKPSAFAGWEDAANGGKSAPPGIGTGRRPGAGLLAGCDGHLSVRLEDDTVLLTPSGVSRAT
jgi:hypothetical protein